MDPWFQMLFSPTMDMRLPSSGDVRMNYSPWTNWGRASTTAGDPLKEDLIFRDVALPGKQLGRLLDAVEVLVLLAENNQQGAAGEEVDANQQKSAFDELKSLAKAVREKKQGLKTSLEAQARESLEALRKEDSEMFKAVLREFT